MLFIYRTLDPRLANREILFSDGINNTIVRNGTTASIMEGSNIVIVGLYIYQVDTPGVLDVGKLLLLCILKLLNTFYSNIFRWHGGNELVCECLLTPPLSFLQL